MKLVIVGAGKVGYSLAANLCGEGHDVTVIDSNRRRLDVLEEHLNLNVVEGNAAKLDTLRRADIKNSDLLIAVTEKDELNMVACFVAKSAGVGSAVARVRAPGYSDFDDAVRLETLGIDMLINPEKVTAGEIAKLIAFPEANYVGYFGEGQVQMLELKLTERCTNLDIPLMEIANPAPCVAVAIERNGELLIPRGDACFKAGDEVLLLANTCDMREIERFLNIEVVKPREIMIVGGSLSGYYLAQFLAHSGQKRKVKLFEADSARCEELAHDLQDTLIINGSASNVSLFEEENISHCDVFVAATEDDKENLFACVLAKSMGAKKTIAQIRGSEYAHIIEKVGVDKVVSPNRLTADAILRFINRSRILSLTRFDDSLGQITEYRVPENAVSAGKTLMELGFPRRAIICMIIRGTQHMIPQGRDTIEPGDTLIVFSMPEALHEVESLLTRVKGEK